MGSINRIIASGFYVGKLPKAQGTVGSLWGIIIFAFVLRYLPILSAVLFVIAFIFYSIYVSQKVADELKQDDPGFIVIDEVAGMLCTYLFHDFNPFVVIVGFAYFRIFDIMKVYPASFAERKFKGGWGIVMDDVFAGIYANLTLWLTLYFRTLIQNYI